MVSPWLAVTHGRCQSTLTEYIQPVTSLQVTESATPAFTVLVGRKTKSEVLRPWLRPLDRTSVVDQHGQVYVWSDADTAAHSTPMVHIDYELQTYDSAQWTSPSGSGSSVERQFNNYQGNLGPLIRRKLTNLLCGRALAALCHTLCYFAADLGGIRVVAALLAQQVMLEPASDLPSSSLPCVLVVVDTTSKKRFDSAGAEADLLRTIGEILRAQHGFHETGDHIACIASHYRQVCVLGVPRQASVRQRSSVVRRKMTSMVKDVQRFRNVDGMLFNATHAFALASKLLDHFCSSSSSTCALIALSRPEGFTIAELESHVEELFSLLPSEIWLWHLAAPLISGAIIVANYPPSAHRKVITQMGNLLRVLLTFE